MHVSIDRVLSALSHISIGKPHLGLVFGGAGVQMILVCHLPSGLGYGPLGPH